VEVAVIVHALAITNIVDGVIGMAVRTYARTYTF
jgi:hypothetical protein